MYCENCGKRLIRGYQFCMECGTPVPPEISEEDTSLPAEQDTAGGVPAVEPINSEGGSLVFCPNCGMHMQSSDSFCEKCGVPLGRSEQGAAPSSGVPLWNESPDNSLGGDFGNMSDEDINQINSFMNGYGGIDGGLDAGIGESIPSDTAPEESGDNEIEALTRQLASFGASTSDMPTINAPSRQEPEIIRQQEPKQGQTREVADFSMEADVNDGVGITDGNLPVIEGASMDENPAEDVSLDPYAFINNEIEGTAADETMVQPAPVNEVSEPVAEEIPEPEPSFSEPAEEIPEPAADVPEPAAEAPAPAEEISKPVEEVSAPVEESEPEDDFFEELPFIEEMPPVIAEAAPYIEEPQPTVTDDPKPEEELNRGNLVYCRNCGQDMYDTEQVCKNCGAPYKGAYIPPRSAPSRSGGESKGRKFTIPIISAAAVVVVGVIVLLVATTKQSDGGTAISDKTLSSDSSVTNASEIADDSETVAAVIGGNSDVIVIQTEEAATADGTAQSEDAASPEKPDTESGEVTAASSTSYRTAAHTTPGADAFVSTKTSTSAANTAAQTVAASTTTTKSSTTAAAVSKPSAKVTSLEKDREAIMDAVAVIAGEVGKLDMFAQNVIYAIDNAAGSADTARQVYYGKDFAKNMLSLLDSGKSSVDSAVAAAEPTNSELKSAYTALESLQKKYAAFYSYVKSPSDSASKYETSCAAYLNDFTNAVSSSFKYTKLITDDYTTSDTSSAYIAAMSDAVTAANNAVSTLTTLQTKLTDLGTSGFTANGIVTELSKSSVTKTYANAAGYAMRTKAYTLMLSGAPSAYSSALTSLQTAANELESLVDVYSYIQEASFSSFKSESNSALFSAQSAIAAVTKAIS